MMTIYHFKFFMMEWKDIESQYSNRLEKLKGKDPYALLEVPHDADIKEIKKAYKMMVKRYHPDVTDAFMAGYSQEVLKLLNEAMEKIKEDKQNDQR